MKTNNIIEYLDEILPNAHCELNYRKDYELLLATMLSAQTTDKRVNMVTAVLFDKYPTLEDLANASLDDIMNIIKPIGTFQKKAVFVKSIAKELLEKQNGVIPNNRAFLESLPGVGRKTTNVVLSNLFNEPYLAVDTHVARVSIRLGLAKEKDDVYTIEKKLMKLFPEDRIVKLHHQLVLFGRYYCMARNPKCDTCKLKEMCLYYKKNC